MDILGLRSVIDIDQIEVGRFYLRTNYGGDQILFQCVVAGQDEAGRDQLASLSFSPGSRWPISVDELPSHGPVVSLDNVAIRVDAASALDTNYSGSVRPNLFFVADTEAYIVAPASRGWITFNITTGRRIPPNWQKSWISFSRWIIVMNDTGEEISIASFGEEDLKRS